MALTYSFPNIEAVSGPMCGSNCCLFTSIQFSQETGKVVWHLHLFKNSPQFIVIHIVKGFCKVNEAEVDVSWSVLTISMIQQMLAI